MSSSSGRVKKDNLYNGFVNYKVIETSFKLTGDGG